MSEQIEGIHLDKRIPLFTLVGLLIQLIGVVWFFAQMASDVEANTNMISRVEISAEARMVRHENESTERYARILNTLERIEDKLNDKADK